MSTHSRESEVALLRRLAEDLAKRRGERATTGHLAVAAIASKPSVAAELLKERRLDAEVLLKAARVVTDDAQDAITRAMQRAIEFASRAQASRIRARCTFSLRSARSAPRRRIARSSSAGPT